VKSEADDDDDDVDDVSDHSSIYEYGEDVLNPIDITDNASTVRDKKVNSMIRGTLNG
jgi:hypothetical protein